jgi:hypothetical protein
VIWYRITLAERALAEEAAWMQRFGVPPWNRRDERSFDAALEPAGQPGNTASTRSTAELSDRAADVEACEAWVMLSKHDVVTCELQVGHDGRHFAVAESLDDASDEPWFAWYDADTPEVVCLPPCDSALDKYPGDPIGDEVCILADGHQGLHTGGTTWWSGNVDQAIHNPPSPPRNPNPPVQAKHPFEEGTGLVVTRPPRVAPVREAVHERAGSIDPSNRTSPGRNDVWARICACEGEVFYQKRGQPFTYSVVGSSLLPSTTNRMLPRSQFVEASTRLPVSGPGELNDLQGPSYLYAILTDQRITGSR